MVILLLKSITPLKLVIWGQLSKSSFRCNTQKVNNNKGLKSFVYSYRREHCALNMNHSGVLKRVYSGVLGINAIKQVNAFDLIINTMINVPANKFIFIREWCSLKRVIKN